MLLLVTTNDIMKTCTPTDEIRALNNINANEASKGKGNRPCWIWILFISEKDIKRQCISTTYSC